MNELVKTNFDDRTLRFTFGSAANDGVIEMSRVG